MKGIDIRGNSIEGKVYTTECYECGMPLLSAVEYHPYAACELFKETHDGGVVRRTVRPSSERVG